MTTATANPVAERNRESATRSIPPPDTDPGEIALNLTGRDYLSHSAISTFQRCPLRYFFAYVAGLDPDFKSSSLIFGGAIHAALEHHCRALLEGREEPELDDLIAKYDESWKTDATTTIRFNKTESVESLRDLAARMLEAFRAHEVSKLDGSIIGIEEEFRGPIISNCPDVLGRLDLIRMERSVLRLVDFKTSRNAWSASKIEEASPQMLLYAELVRELAQSLGCNSIQLEWVVITKGKKSVVETHVLEPEPRQVARIKAVVQRIWQAIAGGHFYPAPSSMSCATCPYRTPCRKWEGGT